MSVTRLSKPGRESGRAPARSCAGVAGVAGAASLLRIEGSELGERTARLRVEARQRGEEVGGGRDDPPRARCREEAGETRHQTMGGTLWIGGRGVPGAAGGGDLQPERALLVDLDAPVERAAGDRLVDAALVEHRCDIREELRVRLEEPAGAFAAAGLLVGDGEEDDRPAARQRRARQVEERLQMNDAETLGVDRAPSPERSIVDLAAVHGVRPARARGYGVDVVEENDGAICGAVLCGSRRRQPRMETYPAVGRDQQQRLDAGGAQQAGEQLGAGALVAGRIRGVQGEVGSEPGGGRGGCGGRPRHRRGDECRQGEQHDSRKEARRRVHSGRSLQKPRRAQRRTPRRTAAFGRDDFAEVEA